MSIILPSSIRLLLGNKTLGEAQPGGITRMTLPPVALRK
jgi:hypothetical protein